MSMTCDLWPVIHNLCLYLLHLTSLCTLNIVIILFSVLKRHSLTLLHILSLLRYKNTENSMFITQYLGVGSSFSTCGLAGELSLDLSSFSKNVLRSFISNWRSSLLKKTHMITLEWQLLYIRLNRPLSEMSDPF